MAIIVEDGTGMATAESYISVVAADTYHSDRGNAAWAALTTPVKEQCLRKATEYMIQIYRHKWIGWRVVLTQALDWPRQGVYLNDFGYPVNNYQYGTYQYLIANNIVPVEVARACAELALIASTEVLAPNLERIESSVSIGNISVVYDKNSPAYTQYRSVDMLLKPFLDVSQGTKIVRT